MIAPLSLTTELRAAPPTFLLVGGNGYVLCATRPTSNAELTNHPNLVPLRAWVVVDGRGRRRTHWVPSFAPLNAVAVAFGITANRAAGVPAATWGLVGPPRFEEAGVVVSVAEIAARFPAAATRRELACLRVDQVNQTYGRMLSDVAYRIENAALFDPTVPTTRRFDEAMVLWSDLGPDASEDDVVRQAGMVTLTFEAARAHAETIGLNHLPLRAREEASRAAKAARLARTTTSANEREVATAQVLRILSSLALHYLPNPADLRRQITPE